MSSFVKLIGKTAAGVVLAISLFVSAATAAQIGISPAFSSIDILGETVTVDLYVSGLEGTELSVFDLNVNYDNSILELVSYSLSDNLGANGDALDLSWPSTSGTVNLAQVSFLDDLSFQADNFSIGTLKFRGIGVGTSLLTITDQIFGDASGDEITMSVHNGSVSVPEPAVNLLFALGFVGLFVLRRKNGTAI